MNPLSKTLLGLLLCLTSAMSFAQTKTSLKPRVFNDYPDQIGLSSITLRVALTSKKDESINIALGGTLLLRGKVISNDQKYENLQSMLVRLDGFNNSLLSISQITNEDKSISYTGRILNQQTSDGYEIKTDASGNYRLQKFETARILPDCSY